VNFLNLLNIRLDDLSDQELRQTLLNYLNSTSSKTIVTPNPEFLLMARHDKNFADILNRADLSLPDGAGLEYAVAALTDRYLTNRHTGVDSLDLLASMGGRLALIGSSSEVAREAAKKLKNKHPQTDFVVIDPGIVSIDGSAPLNVMEEIKSFDPKIIAVALGQRKQEKFIAKILPQLPNIRIAIGIGGALDMIAGLYPRAPYFLRRAGLEWLWRLFREPKRWPRIFRAVIVFPAIVVWATLLKHQFWQAVFKTIKIWTDKKR